MDPYQKHREVSLTHTEDDGSETPDAEVEATADDEAAALDKRDEKTELGMLVDTAPDVVAEADEETTPEEDGHGAQAVPVGSLGKPHSDNGASKNCP
ncbi:unnamed protein product [[Candida] boidinii]|nr:unnamed protein product [[Candida] boidinii]